MKTNRLLIISSVFCLLLGFGAGTMSNTEIGSADSYPSHYLHAQNEIRTVSVNYVHGSKTACDKALDRKVNGYLHSIKNANKYKVVVRPASVGDGNSSNFSNILTDTIQISRK